MTDWCSESPAFGKLQNVVANFKMKFYISRHIRIHDKWDSLNGILTGIIKTIILILIIPILLLVYLFNLLTGRKESEIINKWQVFYSKGKLTLKRKFIDENEIPEDIDYPAEPGDFYLFNLESEPEIEGIKNKFFDYQYVVDQEGIFLLSFNRTNEGMTVWFINHSTLLLEKVKDLDSSWWNFGKKEGKVTLETTLRNKDIKFEIEKTGYNSGLP